MRVAHLALVALPEGDQRGPSAEVTMLAMGGTQGYHLFVLDVLPRLLGNRGVAGLKRAIASADTGSLGEVTGT